MSDHEADSPLAALAKLGLPDPGWAKHETRTLVRGRPQWEYRPQYISSSGLRDIAFLITDGWRVYVDGKSQLLSIRIKQPPTPAEGNPDE